MAGVSVTGFFLLQAFKKNKKSNATINGCFMLNLCLKCTIYEIKYKKNGDSMVAILKNILYYLTPFIILSSLLLSKNNITEAAPAIKTNNMKKSYKSFILTPINEGLSNFKFQV